MKRYAIALIMIAFAACNQSGNDKDKSATDSSLLSTSLVNNPHSANGLDTATYNAKATMDFKDTLHNFGNVQQGEMVQYEFEFTNNGKSPLIISSATGSCGCTVADYPHDPVMPGKSAAMKTMFSSAGKSGHQEKSITIVTNAKRPVYMLYIKADVYGEAKR
jgi:Protein of unknown function (DUF1573)